MGVYLDWTGGASVIKTAGVVPSQCSRDNPRHAYAQAGHMQAREHMAMRI